MDYAIVNAGLLVRLDDKSSRIKVLRFCVGNIESKPRDLAKVAEVAKGRSAYMHHEKRKFIIKILLVNICQFLNFSCGYLMAEKQLIPLETPVKQSINIK